MRDCLQPLPESSKSLKHFCDRYKPEGVIRLSEKNFGTDENVFAVPLYAAFCL
ncbi:MAG: hypothetical protein HFI47_04450 [Lachnospiraceae bacterium]|nr:hypothetical protein [Lachnospiraceae bacterium]